MPELNDFQNDGFGWFCVQCKTELDHVREEASRSRLLSEGEAESKTPTLSTPALAKWADAAQTRLFCPRCGVSESVDVR